MGQNFSWLKQVGHEFEQQREGNLRSAVRKMCVKIERGWFCKQIKGQSKTTKTRLCQLIHKNYTNWGRTWTEVEPRAPIMKCRRNWFVFFVKEIYPEKMMERLNSGESKTIFRNIPCIAIIALTKSVRKAWQEEEETRKDTSSDSSGAILYLRTLQGHSERSLIDPTLQDNVIVLSKFEQQTNSILPACGSHGH